MERGTFRRRIGEHELVRRGRLAATAPRHDVKGKFRIQVRTTRNQTKLGPPSLCRLGADLFSESAASW